MYVQNTFKNTAKQHHSSSSSSSNNNSSNNNPLFIQANHILLINDNQCGQT